ncbi:hypothetical protein EDB85DRAFT_1899630 [Lactarius pseudohatsudake]|nr:hypothetical protein EDB85DRAFT_1899630 [Lactarius pseudohatsudake]
MVLQGHTEDVLVLNYPIQSIVRRTSTSEVEGVLRAVTYSNEVAMNIDILDVDQRVADGVTFRAIRAILDRTPNITTLILQLSFRRFHVFPEVTVLENLINLQSLTCPPSCVRALTSGSPITWLATTHDGVGYTRFPIIKAFNFGIIETSILTTLHTDFDHTSARLLHHISAAAPVLINLKLTESKFSDENACVQMLRDEVDTWEDSFQSLPLLKKFRFRSWKSLREMKGMEDMWVRQWLIFAPPSLCEVRVMTGARQDQCRLAYWGVDDQRGSWRKTSEEMVSKKDIDDDLCQETDDLLDRLEKIHEEHHNDLEATTKFAVRRADDIKDLRSALKEHEIALRNSIKEISLQLEQGLCQMRNQLLKAGRETGPKKDYHSIKRKAELLEGKIQQNLEQSYGCDKKETTDERGNPIRGKRLGIQEYWEHRRGEKRLKYMVRQQRCKGEPCLKRMDTSERLDLQIGVRPEAHWIQELHCKLLIALASQSEPRHGVLKRTNSPAR